MSTSSLLMSKIIDLTDARHRRRVVRGRSVSSFDSEQRKEYRKASDERLFIQVVECSDPDMVGTTLSCHALDVSASGLRAHVEQFIPVGCHLDLWVDNSSRPGKFFLTSDVRWIRAVDDNCYEFGVELHEGAATDIEEWRSRYD